MTQEKSQFYLFTFSMQTFMVLLIQGRQSSIWVRNRDFTEYRKQYFKFYSQKYSFSKVIPLSWAANPLYFPKGVLVAHAMTSIIRFFDSSFWIFWALKMIINNDAYLLLKFIFQIEIYNFQNLQNPLYSK